MEWEAAVQGKDLACGQTSVHEVSDPTQYLWVDSFDSQACNTLAKGQIRNLEELVFSCRLLCDLSKLGNLNWVDVFQTFFF